MKKINYFTHKLLTGAVALALVAVLAQANAETVAQKITVLKVTGSARYMTGGSAWMPLSRGDVLQPGTVIETAAKSTVDIAMGDTQGTVSGAASPISMPGTGGGGGADSGAKANTVRIYESSVLSVDKLTVDKTGMDEVSETQLDLRAGRILGNVKKLSAASRYEVKIPNGVAGIRGTTYIFDATTGNIFVLSGEVDISYVVGGVTVFKKILAGQMFNPTAPGSPNAEPTPISNPPDIGPIIEPPGTTTTLTPTSGPLIKISNN